jgi:hypothetical protein
MIQVTGRIIVAAVLVVGSFGLRSAAEVERQIATAQQTLTIMGPLAAMDDYDAIDIESAAVTRLPLVGSALRNEVERQRAYAAYWLGDYATLPPVGEESATLNTAVDLVMLSANAGFHTVQRSELDPVAAIRGLDMVLLSYTQVLQDEPANLDAAFNYEFVAIQRILLAAGEQLPPLDETQADPSEMHGAQGAPPPDTAPSDFNVIVPMRPDERGEFEAGAGGVRQRQG